MEKKDTLDTSETLLEKLTSYQIENKTFIVESVFSKEGKETLGNVLLRLMKSELVGP